MRKTVTSIVRLSVALPSVRIRATTIGLVDVTETSYLRFSLKFVDTFRSGLKSYENNKGHFL